jgi:hypothetical protein
MGPRRGGWSGRRRRQRIALERAKAWARVNWRKYAVWGLGVIAAALLIRGVIELL